VLEEEADHFPRGIRPARIGVGAGGTASRPGVPGPVDRPLLAPRLAGRIGVDGTAVGMTAERLAALDGRSQPGGRRCGLGDDRGAVAAMDGEILVAVKDDRRHGPGRRAAASIPLTHGASESGAVTVDLTVNFGGNSSGTGFDTLLNVENVTGSNFNDFFIGNAANNVFVGIGGNDKMCGGFGQDRLSGGAGVDTFAYQSTSESLPGAFTHDVVTDFVHGVDKIDLKFIDAVLDVAGDQAFRFVGGQNFGFEGDLRVGFSGNNTFRAIRTPT
jgi:hypothetical protein